MTMALRLRHLKEAWEEGPRFGLRPYYLPTL